MTEPKAKLSKPNSEFAPGEHDWQNRPGIKWTFCMRCGIIQRADKKNKPCKGLVKLSIWR